MILFGVGLPAFALSKVLKRFQRRREGGDSPPSESMLKLWWKRLRGRRGVSAEKEGRAIRMENMKGEEAC